MWAAGERTVRQPRDSHPFSVTARRTRRLQHLKLSRRHHQKRQMAIRARRQRCWMPPASKQRAKRRMVRPCTTPLRPGAPMRRRCGKREATAVSPNTARSLQTSEAKSHHRRTTAVQAGAPTATALRHARPSARAGTKLGMQRKGGQRCVRHLVPTPVHAQRKAQITGRARVR